MQKKVLKEVVGFLHETYPDASIGVSGSVAIGTYREDSDVDILFLRKDVERDTLITFFYEGIKVSLFSFSKEMLHHNDRKYLLNFHNMPITFIANTLILYDKENLIAELKNYVDSVVTRRVLLKEVLINELKTQATYLLQRDSTSVIDDKRKCYSVVTKILSIFFLRRYADKVIEKKEGHTPFVTIMNDDNLLYEELKACLPFHADSCNRLEKLFINYILTF